MTLYQFLLILRARLVLILAILALTVLTTLSVSLLLPKQYTANSALVIDVKSPDPVAGVVLPGMISPSYMATQVDIISSERVAQRVVKLLKLDENPAVRAQWQEATRERGRIDVWLAQALQKNLDVKPSRESNVISISYTATEPQFAASVANAFVQAYIDINLELKVEPARQSATWFEAQTQALRESLEQAQQALSSHQQRTGIVATDERLDFETAKLNELSTALTIAQTQTVDSNSKRGSAGGLAEVMQSPLVSGLRADIARLEAKLQESSLNLGKNHPQTLRAESELAALRDKLERETRQISSSFGAAYQVGQRKQQELQGAIDAQKKKLLELNQQRDEIAVLRRDVETAQRAYDQASQRLSQTRLESLASQTNIMPLSPANEPVQPSRPRVLLNVLVSIFLGTLLGVGCALLLELLNRRVRSAEDLEGALGLPVLASIASSQQALSLGQRLNLRLMRRRPSSPAPRPGPL